MSSLELLEAVYSGVKPDLLNRIGELIRPDLRQIADDFYHHMLGRAESAKFLSNQLVQIRLRNSMEEWLDRLFVPRDDKAELDRFFQRQNEIGLKHARINLPLSVVQVGTTFIKREVFRRVIHAEMAPDDLTDAIVFMDELIDITISVMNQTLVTDMVSDAKDQQTLKMQAIGFDMALQSESLRASLFDWHRQVIRILYEGGHDQSTIPSVRRTNFGLWVLHKGDLLFSGTAEIQQLKELTIEIDSVFQEVLTLDHSVRNREFKALLTKIDKNIELVSNILGLMTDRSLTLEGGRDQLTRLFNRRFLRTVMQREIKTALNTNERFAVLLLDIDFFKKVNDMYGHDAGDLVLQQFSEIITQTIRAGDFLFRYGGEEFLCIITSVNLENAQNVGEKIRRAVEGHGFKIDNSQVISATVSIGLAIFDGHPDYSHLITNADKALYQAKQNGRNQCVFYDE